MSARSVALVALAVLVASGAALRCYATYQGDDISRGTGNLWHFAFSYAVACWVEAERKERNVPPACKPVFMFLAWPLLAPYHFFRTRRWLGLGLAAGLYLLYYVPYLAAVATYFLLGGE